MSSAAASGCCAWNIVKVINDYLLYETITKTELINEIPTLFPSVSICNQNSFPSDLSIGYFIELFIKNGVVKNGLSLAASFPPTALYSTLVFFKNFTSVNIFASGLADSVKQQFGLDLSQMLMSCVYNLKPCSADDFEWYFDQYYGNCLRFNQFGEIKNCLPS
jgi:hypothetical protein